MRLYLCERFVQMIARFFSGGRIGDMEDPLVEQRPIVRKCANIKSRRNPDAPCMMNATHGDFCVRHTKHPRWFIDRAARLATDTPLTCRQLAALRVIARFWKARSLLPMLQHHGIGRKAISMSQNDTELYTMDPVSSIPPLYSFSYVDAHRLLWSFDIRSLGQLLATGRLTHNPYTRELFSDRTLQKIHARLAWLRARRYSVFHPQGAELTADQLWKQRVLDTFMKIEAFGYHVSCDWFHSMTAEDHYEFYKTLYTLWFYRLELTPQQRDAVVPGHISKSRRLFKFSLEHLRDTPHTKVWWEKINLALLEAFTSRSPDKEQQKLGSMYCVMAFVAVNEDAAEVFPWFVHALQ